MKSLIITAVFATTPQKQLFIDNKKVPKIVETILNEDGEEVDMDYKGKVLLINEDFSTEKTIF